MNREEEQHHEQEMMYREQERQYHQECARAEYYESFKPDPNILVMACFTFQPEAKCEYCKAPSNDVYSFPVGTYEYPEDSGICGKCIVENQKKNHGEFNSMDLPEAELPF